MAPTARILLVIFSLWFCFNWYETVSHIVHYYTPLPVFDYWRVVEDLPRFANLDLSDLWRQHNEHRIVFPEVIFALDQVCFEGRQMLPLVVSFLCYAATWFLLARTFWLQHDLPRPVRIEGVLFTGIIMGWPLSAFVLGTPFLLQWTLLQLVVVLALVWVSRLNQQSSAGLIAGIILCGAVATFSSANGLLLWPTIIVFATLSRCSRNQILILATAAVICVGLFFFHYQSPRTVLLDLFKHPVYCAGFVVSYVSMPFGVLRSPLVGFSFGSIAVSLWIFFFIRIVGRRMNLSPYGVVAFGYVTFLLLTAFMTAMGRFDISNSGFLGAKAARYVTLPLAGWALLLQTALWLYLKERWKTFAPTTILILATLVVAFMQVRLGRWLRTNDDFVANQQWAALSIENGLLDSSLIQSIFPEPDFVKRYVPLLRARRESVFADDRTRMLGQTLESQFKGPMITHEPGGVVRLFPVQCGLAVVGWAAILDGHRNDSVLFVNQEGIIVGFGRHLPAGVPKKLLPLNAPESQRWLGFINLRYKSTTFSTYVADSHREKLIQIGEAINLSQGR